jgi:hypothetical protein
MRGGHIADVELLPGLSDEAAIKKSHELFEIRKQEDAFDGFEVWEQARRIIQFPAPSKRTDEVLPIKEQVQKKP